MRDPRLPPSPSISPMGAAFDPRIREPSSSRRYPMDPTMSTSWNLSSSSANSTPPAHQDFVSQSRSSRHHLDVPQRSTHHHQQQQQQRGPQFYPPSSSEYTVTPPRQPAPQTPVHRVYVLNCSTCDTFLTDRGMRAVLLLKPHIVLFSTDAPPCNAETSWPDEAMEEEHVERTCDCLTSSIACHGCGRVVGYHIVAPCNKCTESVQKHQRSANHHRFVFHHNEVSSKERTYYPGERGVHNPVITPAVAPVRPREPSPVPTPVAPRRRVSIYDVEKDLIESRLAPFPPPSPTQRQSSPPAPVVTLLKSGDVLYWHHLVNGGERMKPVDPRSREPVWTESIGR
ncbi:uncharacterized protein JCM6883_006711 [Sporobolomyces salmoneus]|uniref:uncharacterized protein n=1 Tax=Sporobolomyces salmoneus TaxID=183962 RepID=UPI00318219AD